MTEYVPKVGDVLFRAHARLSSLGSGRGRVLVAYDEWRVDATTPRGLWLVDGGFAGWGRIWRKWPGVFAWPTEAEALTSLKRRSLRRYRFASRRLSEAEDVLKALDLPCPRADTLGDLMSGPWG